MQRSAAASARLCSRCVRLNRGRGVKAATTANRNSRFASTSLKTAGSTSEQKSKDTPSQESSTSKKFSPDSSDSAATSQAKIAANQASASAAVASAASSATATASFKPSFNSTSISAVSSNIISQAPSEKMEIPDESSSKSQDTSPERSNTAQAASLLSSLSPSVASVDSLSTFPSPTENYVYHDQDVNPTTANQHPFNTYMLVRQLMQSGYTLGQSAAIMKGMRHIIIKASEDARGKLLSKADLENEAYLFRAALSELRTEIQVHRRNDAAALRAVVTVLTREVDNLNQKLREDAATLKNDLQLDVNNRKAEARTEHKLIEMRIQECNNKFTIRMGDLRTEIEQMKWETMRKGIRGYHLHSAYYANHSLCVWVRDRLCPFVFIRFPRATGGRTARGTQRSAFFGRC